MLHSTSIVNGAADALLGFREVNNSTPLMWLHVYFDHISMQPTDLFSFPV